MNVIRSAALAAFAIVGLSAVAITSASAELPKGAKAPGFTTRAALAGEESGFALRAALAKGPVVLYFYPKAFTQGCTLEANAFADAMPQFKAAGASVIGMSGDDIATLKRFSREECRDAFPVGVANEKIIAAYDVAMGKGGLTTRTSYVIAQDGRIVAVHSDPDYRGHVEKTLAAVRALKKKYASRRLARRGFTIAPPTLSGAASLHLLVAKDQPCGPRPRLTSTGSMRRWRWCACRSTGSARCAGSRS
jgi:thioredoxin-dependent peroxiredoxin